jgi:uncharacterized membrane protein
MAASERRAFQLLHLVLGVGLLGTALDTLVHALRDGQGPLAVVATVAAVGAVLFLIPRTLKVGGTALLVVVLAVLVERTLRGQWRLDLVVFAAAIWLVVVHGGVRPSKPQDVATSPAPAAGGQGRVAPP